MSKEKPVTLEETRIWEKYNEFTVDTSFLIRKTKVIQIYEKSRDLLAAVSKTFPNYTLHNETHIVNVLSAMSGILADSIDNLSIGELEVLIIVASLHDVGMTYTDDQEKEAFANSIQIERFIKERYPGEYELDPENWSENMRQDYLRYLHPFRVEEIIKSKEWSDIFDSWPHDMVSINTIVEICKAHGMTLEEIEDNELLKYSKTKKTDALFCAMMLRLADLLDFDDSRAPSVLFNYAKDNEKSRQEFEKHMASGGFTYPDETSEEDLPYFAVCPSPNVEHAINVFLDWIDEELQNCRFLQEQFKPEWKREMSFPRKVSREEIDTEDFIGGEYCLELNFDQIMKLLSGEELYSQKDVFVRELLQNSIDATLLRAKMDSSFSVEEAPIEMWEWTDSEGRWFRIDDCGTGMTLGMIKKYFLSVGSSYYTSQEIKRDLSQYNFPNNSKYTGISKFGIGFLSCFLCGSFAEISTLHFDENKCRKEYKKVNKTTKYGIRLEMGQNDRFYTIRCQAEGNRCPAPLPCDKEDKYGSDYRNKCGTSVVIKLDTSKLEDLNLQETAEKIICGTRMPIFFNGKRIGKTRSEIVSEYKKSANQKITIELNELQKQEFDKVFPELKGDYPSFEVEYRYFDSKEEMNIEGFTELVKTISLNYDNKEIVFQGVPLKLESMLSQYGCRLVWTITDLDKYEIFRTGALSRDSYFNNRNDDDRREQIHKFFKSFVSCPAFSELGDLSQLFRNKEELEYEWRVYLKRLLYRREWSYRFDYLMNDKVTISYKGIVQGVEDFRSESKVTISTVLLDNEWRPSMNMARTEIISIPLEVNLMMAYFSIDFDTMSVLYKLDSGFYYDSTDMYHWRDFMSTKVGAWLISRMEKHLHPDSSFYEHLVCYSSFYYCSKLMREFVEAYCLENFRMEACFPEGGTTINVTKKTETNKNEYEEGVLFPIMFCSITDESYRNIVCEFDYCHRFVFNRDHYFIKWFIENATTLRKYFNSLYSDLYFALKNDPVYSILSLVKDLASQIDNYGNLCNISSDVPKKLTEEDFPMLYNINYENRRYLY